MKTKQLINTAVGGSTNFRTATGIKKIIEAIAANEHLELYNRSVSQPEGIIDLKLASQVVKMEDQIAAEVERRLKKMAIDTQTVAQVQQVQPTQASNCEICGGPHLTAHCVATAQQIEEIKFLRQNNPYSNTYIRVGKTIQISHGRINKEMCRTNHSNNNFDLINNNRINNLNNSFSNRYQEKLIGSLPLRRWPLKALNFKKRLEGVLPSSTVTNPRENNHVNAVTTRNGKSKEVPEKSSEEEDLLLEVDLEIKENEVANEEVTSDERVVKDKVIDPKPVVKLSFPTRNKKKEQHEKNFEKFLEMFKKLELNIPFLEALEQMPTYAKFMKDIISKKWTIETNPIILTETCSAILQV
ncbi:uncharacterized protein LOC127122775 [Lathyrus oleraceus]|uniref:uncharacterized protein LOC127122775 n=1 Tax=Pisum sativum TaxID=3888 RepID=UPI0021D16412|nr:uncharacterized protein LOC127122775 [Pisum sativum]